MAILSKITSSINKANSAARSYVSQAERAAQEYERFRNDIDIITNTSADTLLHDLQSLSSTYVSTKAGTIAAEVQKGMLAVADTQALLNRVNTMLNDPIGQARNYTNAGSSLTNYAKSYIASAAKKGVSNAFSATYTSKLANMDPVSLDLDLTELVRNLAEDLGMITNKYRGIQYSRNFHFIERPELEADRHGRYRSYVFFTRPDLHLVQATGTDGDKYAVVPDLIYAPELLSKTATDIPLYAELCLSACKKSNLWPLLSNYCKEVAPARIGETFREGTKNMHGIETPIPGAPEYHNIDLSCTFSDNARGDIVKLFDMMQEYKHFVSKENYPKLDNYIKFNANDMAMSIYIVTVDADWQVIGFGVALNCVPLESPSHQTQHKAEGFTKEELLGEFSITFKCKTYKPYRPMYYDYFNRVSGFDPSSMIDTKGEKFTLQASGRAGTGQVNPWRTSVFSNDTNTITDLNRKGQGYGTATYGDYTQLTGISKYDGMLTPTNNSIIEPGQTTGTSKFFGTLPFQGVFEMLAKKPGIYRGINLNEPNRPVFKLGFSY